MVDEKPDQTDHERDKSKDQTPGGLPQEHVEDRPNVSQVTPDDYPKEQRERF